ncbi:hypothetical protein TESG_08681 [Trichophyton tonsurans CBS 112818]|uniref:Uncharacterized protein n=1 Tax=Trichophyton tonsurans (strain CBS 112818) TaxID=647933 RepID=F2SBH5_TRIT1|nr:hypothetical protein TESG_08681 [Trichophyton tonsurans CBS 112818]
MPRICSLGGSAVFFSSESRSPRFGRPVLASWDEANCPRHLLCRGEDGIAVVDYWEPYDKVKGQNVKEVVRHQDWL